LFLKLVNKKIRTNSSLIIISIIIVSSIILRLYYFPYNIPVTFDALDYFWYASDIKNSAGFPKEYGIGNNGWPILLSLIFNFFNFDNFLDYMMVQRHTTVIISTLTIIPIYFLCRRFFDKTYSLLGALFFSFEPRLIQNSLLGIIEPTYILLSTICLVFFFHKKRYLIFLSFTISGIATIFRSEGIFLFVGLSIAFFLKQWKEEKKFLQYSYAIGLYFLTIIPMIFWRIQYYGEDLITSRFSTESSNIITKYSLESNEIWFASYLIDATYNFVKLFGWSLFPLFFMIFPVGIYLLFKEKNSINKTLLVLIGIFLIPVYLSFSVANDLRYSFFMFPLVIVVSVFGIKQISKKRKNIFLLIIICSIILSSITYLEIKSVDRIYQVETFNFAKEVVERTKGINDYYPQSMYLEPASMSHKWPSLKSSYMSKVDILDIYDDESIYSFIKSNRNNGLTHIIADDYEKRVEFLRDVYIYEDRYPYLIKIFDSHKSGYMKYNVKIFSIDYETFDKIKHS